MRTPLETELIAALAKTLAALEAVDCNELTDQTMAACATARRLLHDAGLSETDSAERFADLAAGCLQLAERASCQK